MAKRTGASTKRKICIAGVGGGGCRVVAAMSAVNEAVLTAAIDTDAAALAGSSANTKLQIGGAALAGLGAGGDARVGARAAEDDVAMLQNLFSGVEMAVVVAALGGGTGTGATPVVLRAAREADAATLCVAAIPFEFEGRQRRDRADAAVVNLLEDADTLVVMRNDRLVEATGKTAVADSFKEADRILGEALDGIWGLLVWPGYLNLGFADLRRIVRRSGGVCTLGYGWGSGRGRVEKALAELLDGPLLDHGRLLAEARGMLVSIMGGADLTIQEVGEVMNAIKGRAKENAEVEVGTVVDEAVRGKLRVTVIASEAWSAAEREGASPPAEAPSADAVEFGEPAPAEKKPGKGERVTQTRLNLDQAGKGRFKDVEPTLLDGEDLDIPTFLRRGLRVER